MSNASNLSTFANVLDDGTSGQVLTSQGSGVVAFADAGGTGVTVHTNQAAMLTDAASASEGSLHYETANNKLYVKQNSGFFLLASITNTAPTVSSFTETTGSGSASAITDNGTFALTSGSNTVITLTATDPDLETLVYSATVTSGTASNVISSPSLPISNQSGNTFTLTPVTSGVGGTITIRFDVSDGNNVVNKTHSFSIAFKVVDSNYTTLLATATGTSDNNNITYIDSSGNTQNPTVNGDAYAGTFSPYRSGGYSTFFNTATSQNAKIDLPTTVFNSYSTSNASTSNFTIQAMIYPTGYADTHSWGNSYAMAVFAKGNVRVNLGINSSGYLIFHHYGTSANDIVGSSQVPLNEWSHVAIICTNGSLSLKLNGTQVGTSTWTGVVDPSGSVYVGAHNYTSLGSSSSIQTGDNGYFKGYIADFKISGVAETITAAPTERAVSDSNTQLLLCHLPYIVDGSSNSVLVTTDDVSTKPFSPYDNDEYSAADNGGSVYFDTSDDYLTVSNGSWKTYGSNNFTIECWFYTDKDGMLWGDSSTSGFGDNCTVIADLKDFNGANAWVQVEFRVGSTKYGINPAQGTFKRNTWNHIAFVRNGNTFTVYSNGKNVGNTSQSGSMNTSSNDWAIASGWPSTTGTQFNGYISDFRVSKSARYTAEFTPPTAPLSSSGAELHIKGTDASIIDKSQGSNLKLVGNTTGSTTTKFTGAKSMYFDGNGDYADITIEPIGAGDFTVEFWVNDDGSGDSAQQEFGGYLSLASSGSQSTGIFFSRYNFMVGGNSTDWGSAFPNTFTATHGTGWSHIAMCRSGTTVKVYVDGTLEHTVTGISADLTNTDLRIASRWNDNTSYLCPCYIQDLRISKGKARYTAADETSNIPSAPLEG